jgi:hypothetical protein
MRADLTQIQVRTVVTMLRDAYGEEQDEKLLLDMLEGQTDLFEISARLLDKMEREEGDRDALTKQMDDRKVRRDRCDARIKTTREAIAALMTCAGIDKLPLPEATVSLRVLPPSIKVNDPAAVPEEYTVPKPVPDLDKIKAAFAANDDALPNWLRVEPERPSLTIRRK